MEYNPVLLKFHSFCLNHLFFSGIGSRIFIFPYVVKTRMTTILLVAGLIFFTGNSLLAQTTFTASSGGNWTTYSWTKSGTVTTATYPGQPGYESETHDVVITGGGGITLNSNIVSSVRNVTVNATGLSITSWSLTMTGNLSGTGSVSFSTGTVNIAGNNTIGSFTSSNGTFNYNGAGQAVKGGSYYNLVISGTNTKTAAGSITVSHEFTVNSTFQAANNAITINGITTINSGGVFTTNSNLGLKRFRNVILSGGTMSNTFAAPVTMDILGSLLVNNNAVSVMNGFNSTISGTATIDAGATLRLLGPSAEKTFGSQVTINGSWDNQDNENIHIENGLAFNGNSFISGTGEYNFTQNFSDLSGTSPITFNGEVSVDNGLRNRANITIRGNLTGAGIWSNENGSVLNYEDSNIPAVATFIVNTNSNIVSYSAAGDQEIRRGTYYHLQTSGSGQKTLEDDISVLGDLTIGSGTTLNVSTHDYQINLAGSWINNGTFNEQEGKVLLNGTGPQSISNSVLTDETFYRFETNTTGPVTSNVNIAVSNTLTLSSGKIVMPSNTMTLGTGAAVPGTLVYTSGWINGSMARWVADAFDNVDVLFPVGDNNYNRRLTLNIPDIINAGIITAGFAGTAPSDGGLPLFDGIYHIRELFPEGYWNLSKDPGLTYSGDFDIRIVPSGFTSFTIDGTTRVVSRDDGGNWSLGGNHFSGSVSLLGRDNMNAFRNHYAVAHTEVCHATFINCPTDITVNAAPGTCANTVTWTAPSMSVACPTYTITTNHLPGESFNVGTTQVVYKLLNGGVETDFCIFDITVVDNGTPEITCAGNQTRNVNAGSCYYQVVGNEMDPVHLANFCPYTVTNDLNGGASLAGTQIPAGVTTVLWTISGMSGNSASCTMDITVVDNIAPSVGPVGDRTEFVDGSCSFTVPDYSGLSVITDNCGSPVVSQNPVAGTIISGAGTVQAITLTAVDPSGNSSGTSFNVTLADNVPPVAICRDITVQLNASGNVSITAADVNNGSSDNCSISTIVLSKTDFTCADLGTQAVIMTVTDGSGNTATCTSNVTVADNVPPAITCPANIIRNSDPGVCTASVAVPAAVTSDNCAVTLLTWVMSGATVASSPASGINPVGTQVFNNGVTTVTYTVGDASGNNATCSFTVTVNDAQNPVITGCPANIVQNVDPGSCGAVVTWTEPAATDNCTAAGTLVWTKTNIPGNTFPVGVNPVTYTVQDATGNISTCTFTVTITDNIAPALTCPANITQNAAPGACSATVATPDPTKSDNCAVVLMTWTMAGANNEASPLTGLNKVGSHTFNVGTTTVTYNVSDAAGNTSSCNFTVTVNDNQVPVISGCPSNITQAQDAGLCTAVVTWTEPAATDNCTAAGALTWTRSHLPGSIFPSGTTTVTYTVQDAAGNTSTCTFTVTVNDAQPPTVTCPASISQNADAGVCTATIAVPDATTNDNCGVTLLTWAMTGATTAASPATGINQVGTHTFNPGTTTVTFTVADAAGNTSTCSYTVTISENQPPVIACPANISRNADAGVCTASVAVPAAVTSDNCAVTLLTWTMAGATTASSPATGINQVGTYSFNTGTTTVSYTVGDGAGNTAGCSFTVTVADSQAPTLTCPANITRSSDAGVCTASIAVANAVVTDNCAVTVLTWSMSGATTAASPAAGINQVGTYTFNPGTTSITYTAGDAAGNTSVCSFSVTVNDTEGPVISGCPSNITQAQDAGTCNAIVTWTEPSATDNCTAAGALTWTRSHLPGSTFPTGNTTVTYSASDAAGNISSCSFTVRVTDTEIPTITCSGNISRNADAGACTASVTVPDAVIADNCAMTLTWIMTGATTASSPATGINQIGTYVFRSGITNVTYTLTDEGGNTVYCTFTANINANDTQVPAITCPADLTQNTLAGSCSASVTVPDPVTSDNCFVTLLTWVMTGATNASSPATGINPVGTYTFNGGTTTVTYIVGDGSGNTSTCSFTVTIADNEAPSVTCPANVSQNAAGGACTASVVVPAPVTADNCGVATVINSFNGTADASGTYPIGETLVTWTVTDLSGNTSSCSHTVTVIAALMPSLSSSDPDNSICIGEAVTFTATGGVTYEFLLNGVSVQGPGANNVYTASSLANQDRMAVRVVDGSGCEGFTQGIITTVNSLPSGNIAGSAGVKCFGGSDGALDLLPSGGTSPYTYTWSNGATTEDIGNLAAGSYSVTITDANNCSAVVSGIVTEPASAVTVTVTKVDISCYGLTNGSATAIASGGTAPHSYSWNTAPVQSTSAVTGLSTGLWTVTTTDGNGCTATASVQISEPAELSISETHTIASCPDESDASITLTITGGTQPYSALWSDGSSEVNRAGIDSGNYRVIITDSLNCSEPLDIVISFEGGAGCLMVPQVITPNNDGYNDTWMIRNIDLYPDAEVKVFNRWGDLVWRSRNVLASPWDGTWKGQLVPSDSYHYILYLNDGSDPRTGVITVIR